MGYRYQVTYRKRNPHVRTRERKKYYAQSMGVDVNGGQFWTHEYDDLILSPNGLSDLAIAHRIGRSLHAIQCRRCVLKREQKTTLI
jgi:hypothetical protein